MTLVDKLVALCRDETTEIVRLRKGLEVIADWPTDTDAWPDSEDYMYWQGGATQAEIARRVLAGEST